MKVLLPLAWLFQFIVWLRNWCFDVGVFANFKLPGKVVSIGNIAIGGTGKSPVVIDYANRAVLEGSHVAIVTRGYKSGLGSGEWRVYVNGEIILGNTDETKIADEAVMESLALKSVPVIVGVNRKLAATEFMKLYNGPKINYWILDDGFQHRQLHRDVDVVLIDGRKPFGDVLPAGRFRESIGALKRAHEILITKADSDSQIEVVKSRLSSMSLKASVRAVKFVPTKPVQVSGARVEGDIKNWQAVVGIAQPEDFLRDLKTFEILPLETLNLADHESVDDEKLQRLASKVEAVITTEKDWARDRSKFLKLGTPVFVLPITMQSS